MNHPEFQKDFSEAFVKYKQSRFDKRTRVEYPFSFLESYDKKTNPIIEIKEFNYGFEYFSELQNLKEHSYKCFEYELSLIGKNKYLYINDVTSQLYKTSQKLKVSQESVYVFEHNRMLFQIASNILKDIFMYYHLDLDSRNIDRLSKWFHLKEPIISFRFSKHQEEKRLEKLFNKYLCYDFIELTSEFDTFKALFQGRVLENKINWTHNKSSLYYFIKLLVSNKVVKSPKNKHWKITAEFFLIKGETLLQDDFLNQKETQDQIKREALEKFVKALMQ